MPLRANSKSIADKNVRNIAGRPLFFWSLEQAIKSQCFDAIYVATDSLEIRKKVFDEFPSEVVIMDRSAATCTDSASTESAMLEFQIQVHFDVICLIQATSPLTQAEDFCSAKRKFLADNLDSLLTAVQSNRFFWTMAGAPVNYDPAKRSRRQDIEGYLMENGAFYLTRANILRDYGNRLGGRIGIHQMADETAIEIDEVLDWQIVEQLLLFREKLRSTKTNVLDIKALVLDVDGTLTDGGMYYGPKGEALKKFHTRDAYGLQLLNKNGIKVCVMSAETSPAVEARMKKLHIHEYYPGVQDKFQLLLKLMKLWGICLQDIAYIGDDLNDLECLKHVGLAFCPANSVPEVLCQAHQICKHYGGNGAVRETCDFILRMNATNSVEE